MAVVFTKTRKGLEAIETRSGGLTPRVRRVLIMIDSHRTVDDLRNLLAADDLTHTLGMLEEDGYIEVLSVTDGKSAAARPANQPLPSITAFKPILEQADDPTNLARARNFMTNTLNAFVGTLGASSLLERIDIAHGHQGLRSVFDEWYHAIVTSRDGRREAEILRTKLLAVI